MSARKRINKTKFYAINRDVKVPGSQVKTVATAHNVSEETVRTIKRARTWPRFEAMKKLKNERRRPTYFMESAKPQLLPLVTPEEQLDKITQNPASQIRPVPSEEIKVVTVAEWEALQRKLGTLYRLVAHKRRSPLLSIFRRTK